MIVVLFSTKMRTEASVEEEAATSERMWEIVSAMPGFISYYSAYDRDRGTVTSVTVYETRESAEEATRLAEEWGRQNLAIMGTMHPTAWVGEVLVHASAY